MSPSDIISVASLVLVALVVPAMAALHKTRTVAILKEERPETLSLAAKACAELVEVALDKEAKVRKASTDEERERAKDLFAAKHDLAEMRGEVRQLVTSTSKLDEKLDRVHDLLLEYLREARKDRER